jgi:hypothetical protein
VLDGLGVDFDAASRDVGELERVWSDVRARVIGQRGKQQADAYDAHVVAVRDLLAAKDASNIPDEANVGLELVDAMEKLFE